MSFVNLCHPFHHFHLPSSIAPLAQSTQRSLGAVSSQDLRPSTRVSKSRRKSAMGRES